jgi:hypothetical protein
MDQFTQVNPMNPYHYNQTASLVNSQSPSNAFSHYYNPYQNSYSGQTSYNVPPPMMGYNPVN